MDRFSKEYASFRASPALGVREGRKRKEPAPKIPERLVAWHERIAERPAVQRGMQVPS